MSDFQSYSSDNLFSSSYTPIDNINTSGSFMQMQQNSLSQNLSSQNSSNDRTPSIPYNYMPRQNYTSSPGELQSYTSNPNETVYDNSNYQQPPNMNYQKTYFDFSNPNTAGTSYLPLYSNTSIIPK
jgi:hypothetical protein